MSQEFTPGVDDDASIVVNPVLAYKIDRSIKKERTKKR